MFKVRTLVGCFSHLLQNEVSFASRGFMVYYISTTRNLSNQSSKNRNAQIQNCSGRYHEQEKVLLVLSIVFAILTFCGAGYNLYTGEKAKAGYACVSYLF